MTIKMFRTRSEFSSLIGYLRKLHQYHYEQSRAKRGSVNLQRGFAGQSLAANFGKFKKAELHQGLSAFCGDLLILE